MPGVDETNVGSLSNFRFQPSAADIANDNQRVESPSTNLLTGAASELPREPLLSITEKLRELDEEMQTAAGRERTLANVPDSELTIHHQNLSNVAADLRTDLQRVKGGEIAAARTADLNDLSQLRALSDLRARKASLEDTLGGVERSLKLIEQEQAARSGTTPDLSRAPETASAPSARATSISKEAAERPVRHRLGRLTPREPSGQRNLLGVLIRLAVAVFERVGR